MRDFGELITSMITPFDQQLQMDQAKLFQLVDWLIQTGTDGVIVGGMVGESESLTRDEKLILFKTVKKFAQKRLKVIASVTMETIQDTLSFVEQVDELGYADALFVTIPYYTRMDQKGIITYVKDIMEVTELPLVLYNGPIKTGVYMEPDTVIQLSKLKSVIGIQEASEDLPNITKIIAGADVDFAVYAGDDRYGLPILALGAKGVVSVASHLFGKEIKELIFYYKRGEVLRASERHQELSLFYEDLYQRGPAFIKSMLKAQKMNMGGTRNIYYETENDDDVFAQILLGGNC